LISTTTAERTQSVITIRAEQPEDRKLVADVHRRAFGRDAEARLVDQLHADQEVIVSLVAIINGQIVGHALFSRLPIETAAGEIAAAALGPLAVLPEWQRRGIGSALVWRGIGDCRARGRAAVVVLGHPTYYPRFGFSAALAARLHAPYSGEAFMALELIPGALAGGGVARYPAAFQMRD
jgi:putative acetyltransferase